MAKNFMKFDFFKNKFTLIICLIFSICGGFMDTYSYIKLGGVFANAQTGNLIFMGITLYKGLYREAFKFLLPVIFFSLGVFISTFIEHLYGKSMGKNPRWKIIPLIIEVGLFLIIPQIAVRNIYVANVMISLICGMQLETFKEFKEKKINTTMCVGNLGVAAKSFSLFIWKNEIGYFRDFLIYSSVIISFIIGAIVGNFFIHIYDINSIYICALILCIPLVATLTQNRNRKNANKKGL